MKIPIVKNYTIIFAFLFFSYSTYATDGTFTDTIVTSTGLKYVVLKKGDGEKPKKGDKVTVHYRGELPSGKVFDTSRNGRPFKFKIGKQQVIPGWEEGVTLMRRGEIGVLIVPAHLAYGKRGVRDEFDDSNYEIPPDSELIFEMELLHFK
ncbi:FKBP-type peptidyl-prolyl cis-trans isomerase [Cytophagaceae bacterium ABcell3]|nr:FKBP-type peptidyl-prolyl cis-trans isomerase [Cytophagaceae bacterium ABcell3]